VQLEIRDDDLVFFMHQGYQLSLMRGAAEEPAIVSYSEPMGPVPGHASLALWLSDFVDDWIRLEL
jgi:hypothetical protein